MKIIFDLDGTLADLYGVDDWLPMLRAEDATPYREANPMVNMSRLARAIHKAQRNNIQVTVVSWGSMGSSADYLAETETAKREWLASHLPSVDFDDIAITPYGVDKSLFATADDILFDDNDAIRENFIGNAFTPDYIFDIIKEICD